MRKTTYLLPILVLAVAVLAQGIHGEDGSLKPLTVMNLP